MLTARSDSGAGAPALAAMRVHLFWRDANRTVGGYLASLAGAGGLDAVLAAGGAGLSSDKQLEPSDRRPDHHGCRPQAGYPRYETVLTGVERVRARTAIRLREPVSVTGLRAAAVKLAEHAGIQVKPEQMFPPTRQ